MKSISIEMGNGKNLVAAIETDPSNPKMMSIYIADGDTYEQGVADILVENDHEVTVSTGLDEDGDWSEQFIVELTEPSESEDDEPEDETDISIEETSEVQEVLSYGDKGDLVKEVQRRLKELGYFGGSIYGNYLTLTENAVKAFQLDAGLQVDGICDSETMSRLFDDIALQKTETARNETPEYRTAKKMDWWKSDIQKIFAKGVTATITDVETGLTWKEQRRGGTNHADVQPLTKEDTANLKKAYGGKWSWNRRAIWVTINGENYAASMNGMPHGGSSIKNNNFDGHHCIHFTNSRTHCSNKVCPNHQKMIEKAANAKML